MFQIVGLPNDQIRLLLSITLFQVLDALIIKANSAEVANPRFASRMWLFAWFHATLFHMLCFFYQQPGSR